MRMVLYDAMPLVHQVVAASVRARLHHLAY